MDDLALDQAFPIRKQRTFLNHAGVAPLSGPAADAIGRYARQARDDSYIDAGWYIRARELKRLTARLLHAADPDGGEIALLPNTSTGLSLVARGLDWHEGDQVLITDAEYPANRYPWQDLDRLGVRWIQARQESDGRFHLEQLLSLIGPRTRLVSLSHVQFATGYRIDLAPIASAVHRVGGYLCVDAIQSLGALPVDVQSMGIDFLSADGHKWLLGPEGCGVFYCRRELVDRLHPAVVGWMNMTHAWDFDRYRFEFQPDARRFEPGSYNVPGLLGLAASMELLLHVGIDVVWQRIERLTARLCEGLADKGYRVFSPRSTPEERSGIVSFAPPDRLTDTDPAAIVRRLDAQSVHLVVRAGRLRASPHFYNTPAQIDRLLALLPT